MPSNSDLKASLGAAARKAAGGITRAQAGAPPPGGPQGVFDLNGTPVTSVNTDANSGVGNLNSLTGSGRLLANVPAANPVPSRLISYAAQPQLVATQVSPIYDTGALRTDATQATAGRRANVVLDANGERCLRFVRSSPTHYDCNIYQRAQQARSFALTARFKLNTASVDGNIVGMYGAGTELFQFYIDASNVPTLWSRDGGTPVLRVIQHPTVMSVGPKYVMTGCFNGLDSFICVDGVVRFGDMSGLATQVWTGSKLGCANAATANPIDADIYRIDVTSGAMTAGQYRALYREMTGNSCLRLIFDGNSITAGQGSELYTMPQHVTNALGALQVSSDNIAVGGAHTVSRMTNWQAQALSKIHPFADMVAVIAEATNEIYFAAGTGTDTDSTNIAAAAVANVYQWCQMYRNAGCKVVLWDIIARQSFTPFQRIAAAKANALFRANAWQYCDAFVAASEFFPDYTDASIYQDGTHLLNAGYLRLANALLPSIKRVAALL